MYVFITGTSVANMVKQPKIFFLFELFLFEFYSKPLTTDRNIAIIKQWKLPATST